MGHYSDLYDEDHKKRMEQSAIRCKHLIDEALKSGEDMYRIESLIEKREEVISFFDLMKRGL